MQDFKYIIRINAEPDDTVRYDGSSSWFWMLTKEYDDGRWEPVRRNWANSPEEAARMAYDEMLKYV